MTYCEARLEGAEERLPLKSKAKPPRPEYHLVALVEGEGEHEGRILVRQRPNSGLLARMWELPYIPADARVGEGAGLPDGPAMDRLAAALAEAGVPVRPIEPFMNAEHTFSHIHWNLRVFRFQEAVELAAMSKFAAEAKAQYEINVAPVQESDEAVQQYRWINRDDMADLAFPNVFLRILDEYSKKK
ncbi:putative A/G-specific adenine glycosylase YfhQ [compost metagenome]